MQRFNRGPIGWVGLADTGSGWILLAAANFDIFAQDAEAITAPVIVTLRNGDLQKGVGRGGWGLGWVFPLRLVAPPRPGRCLNRPAADGGLPR